MKIYLRISTLLHTHRAFTACFCSLALLLSNRFCFAVDCFNDGTVTLMNEETLASNINPMEASCTVIALCLRLRTARRTRRC
jgi:hypothetical protein